MKRPNPTLHEVARAAGVSIATVSRVVHGSAGVSAPLRQRVETAIADLGYRPSHSARALVQRRHGALGVVFPGLYGPYYAEVIHGIESVAIANRMAVLILGTHHLESAADHVLALADRTDGLAILGGTVEPEVIGQLRGRGVRVVLMAQRPAHGLPTVRVDNHDSTAALTRHLVTVHGRRRLVFLGNTDDSPDIAERWQGFLDGHAELGLDPPEPPIQCALEVNPGHDAARAILRRPRPPQGIVCGNDEVALGVLSAARALAVDVPRDLAVTGWDDIPLAAHTYPTLTTVRQPARALGARTASLLIDRIGGVAADGAEVVLATNPIYRRSCGCDPPGDGHATPA